MPTIPKPSSAVSYWWNLILSSVDVAFAAAEANLARTVRTVRGEFSRADSSDAQVAQARVALAVAQADYQRRQSAAAGVVSGEELSHARDQVRAAQAALTAAQGGYQQSRAGIAGTNVARNPDVLAAEATLRNAAIVQSHMRIVSPVDGVIAQRTVQIGQQVQAGAPLMAVVPLEAVWIDANFKEVQLARMRVGQPVDVTADMYGSDVTYHGHVEGLGAGSGSAFALLPPQNASGNWIKIVQRVPVRIAWTRRNCVIIRCAWVCPLMRALMCVMHLAPLVTIACAGRHQRGRRRRAWHA